MGCERFWCGAVGRHACDFDRRVYQRGGFLHHRSLLCSMLVRFLVGGFPAGSARLEVLSTIGPVCCQRRHDIQPGGCVGKFCWASRSMGRHAQSPLVEECVAAGAVGNHRQGQGLLRVSPSHATLCSTGVPKRFWPHQCGCDRERPLSSVCACVVVVSAWRSTNRRCMWPTRRWSARPGLAGRGLAR